jgi:hypothetical protein
MAKLVGLAMVRLRSTAMIPLLLGFPLMHARIAAMMIHLATASPSGHPMGNAGSEWLAT